MVDVKELEMVGLMRRTNAALGLAAIALVLGPVAGFVAAKATAVPGPIGPAGPVGPMGADGPQGPPGVAPDLSGSLVLAEFGCRGDTSNTFDSVYGVSGFNGQVTFDVCEVR